MKNGTQIQVVQLKDVSHPVQMDVPVLILSWILLVIVMMMILR